MFGLKIESKNYPGKGPRNNMTCFCMNLESPVTILALDLTAKNFDLSVSYTEKSYTQYDFKVTPSVIRSVTQSCLTLCDPMNRSMPGLPVHHQLRELIQTHVHLAISSSVILPPIPPSIRVFYNESTLRMRWPKYWSFSFSIIPSKEIPGLISFRMDWLGMLVYY